MIRKHLSRRDMNRLVDGVLSAERTLFARKHVSECRRCREPFEFITDLREAAGDLYQPVPPARILEHVLAARAEGHRAILPQSVAVRHRRRLNPAFAVSILLGLITVAGLLLLSKEAEAGSSQLLFDPPRPTDQELIRVEYHPGALLAGEEFVYLRARFRMADDRSVASGLSSSVVLGEEAVATLVRRADGIFEGTLVLPADVVYAATVLEDQDANNIDTNSGRLWELLRHGMDGRPVFSALRQRYFVANSQRPGLVADPIKQMTELHPDKPEAWYLSLAYAMRTAGASRDSVADAHRDRFLALLESNDPATMAADQLAGLASYARLLSESAAFTRLAAELESRFPLHPTAEFHRRMTGMRSSGSDVYLRLEQLDAEWQFSHDVSPDLLKSGWGAALASGQELDIGLWATRVESLGAAKALEVAKELTEWPSLRSTGIREVRRELERTRNGEYGHLRPLTVPETEFEKVLSGEVRSAKSALAVALLASGEIEEGLALFRTSSSSGWDTELFREAARQELAHGDTANAVRHLARLSIDPIEIVDNPNVSSNGYVNAKTWERERRIAQLEFVDRVMAGLPFAKPLPSAIVYDASGRETALLDVLLGRTSVVILFWSYDEVQSDSEQLETPARLLEDAGIQLVQIVGQDPGAIGSESDDSGVALDYLYDPFWEASAAFGVWQLQAVFVVDELGRIRSNPTSVREAIRPAVALKSDDLLAS